MRDLATPAAVTLFGRAPDGRAGGWDFYGCRVEPFQPCRELHNDAGDVVGLQVDPSRLGRAGAVTRSYVDITPFPSRELDYLYVIIDAWNNANAERVATLIDGKQPEGFFTYVTPVGDHSAFTNYTSYDGSAGHVCVKAQAPDGVIYIWGFDMARLGRAHALVWAGSGTADASTVCQQSVH